MANFKADSVGNKLLLYLLARNSSIGATIDELTNACGVKRSTLNQTLYRLKQDHPQVLKSEAGRYTIGDVTAARLLISNAMQEATAAKLTAEAQIRHKVTFEAQLHWVETVIHRGGRSALKYYSEMGEFCRGAEAAKATVRIAELEKEMMEIAEAIRSRRLEWANNGSKTWPVAEQANLEKIDEVLRRLREDAIKLVVTTSLMLSDGKPNSTARLIRPGLFMEKPEGPEKV